MWARSSQPAMIRPSISQANMRTSGNHILFMMMTAPTPGTAATEHAICSNSCLLACRQMLSACLQTDFRSVTAGVCGLHPCDTANSYQAQSLPQGRQPHLCAVSPLVLAAAPAEVCERGLEPGSHSRKKFSGGTRATPGEDYLTSEDCSASLTLPNCRQEWASKQPAGQSLQTKAN